MNIKIKHFEKEFHNKSGYHYEQRWVEQPRFKYHYERIARHVKTYFKGKKSIILVDIGCGTGRGSLFFAETCAHIIGLDISLSLLKIFKEKSSLKGLNNVDLILCDAENPPLRTEIADLVTFFGTLHHLPNKIKALHEASRLLRLGGITSLHEPNEEASQLPWVIGSPLSKLKKIIHLSNDSTDAKSEDITPYETCLRLTELKEQLLDQGLITLEAKTVWFLGIIPMKLPQVITRLYYYVANMIDELLEKFSLYGSRAGAVFIIAQRSETFDE